MRYFVANPASILRMDGMVYVHAEMMEWKIVGGRI
jgi:hypothetical protein